ncbi:MAG TPA: SgcJ/EcaC family oxidoreductase [Streptosporangiaceae bacterium]|nr:SgcJ/EcaC family oxidoreductase [Streptosporangiaceae bacterium]
MTTSNTTAAGTSQDSAIRAVFAQTSRAWADGDGEAFAAWYAPDATVILPGVYLPGQDAIREAMAAAFAGPLKNTRRSHQVRSIRFTSPGTAIVITDSVTVPPGKPQPVAQQRERATWVLSRSDGRWLIHAYHSSPGGEDVQ